MYRGVKTETGVANVVVSRHHVHVMGMCRAHGDQSPVADHYAFGFPGRTRCVDHIGQVVRTGQIGHFFYRGIQFDIFQEKYVMVLKIPFFPLFGIEFLFRYQHGGSAVFQHIQQAVNGVFTVHGYISGPGFLDPQHGDHVFFPAG